MAEIKGTYMEESALETIADALAAAIAADKHAEVVHTAFVYIKENPESSITEAIGVSLDIWKVDKSEIVNLNPD